MRAPASVPIRNYHPRMKRRHYLILQTGLLSGAAMADTPKVQSLDEALLWLDKLEHAKQARSSTA